MEDEVKDDKIHKYKMVIWKGMIIPTRKVIKFLCWNNLEEVRKWLLECLDGNAIAIKDINDKLHCLDRTNIRSITVKEMEIKV